MNTAYVIDGKLIDHNTIKLQEPVPVGDSDVTVILELKEPAVTGKKENQLKLAEMRGKIKWEGSLDELRKSRI